LGYITGVKIDAKDPSQTLEVYLGRWVSNQKRNLKSKTGEDQRFAIWKELMREMGMD